MKKYSSVILLLCIALISFSCSSTTEATKTEIDADPSGMYKIDVKTTFTNKYTATGVKNGHISYMRIRGGKWCVDREVGEDYSFWLKDVRSTNVGDSTIVRFDLELRTPAMITEGDLILRRTGYVITYPNNPDFAKEGNADAQAVSNFIGYTLSRNVTMAKRAVNYASSIAGAPETGSIINYLVSEFFSDAKIKQSQIEGALVGVVTFAEMRDMLKVSIEKK